MKGFNLTAANLERPAVLQETLRVFDVCDGCRRCFNLCPSFATLFKRIDAGESDLSKLKPADYEQVADECYYCKLCYNHCPYTPPHRYEIDFPRLMIGWKKLLAQERGVRWRDWLLVRTDWLGKVGTTFAPAPPFAQLGVPKIERTTFIPYFVASPISASYSDQSYAGSSGSLPSAGLVFAAP